MVKKLTSAIPGMNVANMKRCLLEVRTMLEKQNDMDPFNMNLELSNGMTVSKFVHLVAVGLYAKRAKHKNRVDENISSESEYE